MAKGKVITAGVDIGSLSTNAAIFADGQLLASHTIRTGVNGVEAAERVMQGTIQRGKARLAELEFNDIDFIVATGYGRVVVPFSHKTITEISCHAMGSHWTFPEVRTILDIGGQDCKAIRCDSSGRVTNFKMNDKCAAGTGRYLERTASTLGIELDDFGPLSLQTQKGPATISNVCTVFAQRDILLLQRQGIHRNDILAGACQAIVERIHSMFIQVGIEEALVISGGVAKNIGVVRRLEEKSGVKAYIAADPQITGAIGAALFARQEFDSIRCSNGSRVPRLTHKGGI